MDQEQEDNQKWYDIYHKQHWGGMTIKRLSIGWSKGLIYRYEKGGHVRQGRII